MKCRRCEKRKAAELHYLCEQCYTEDDGEPKNPGAEIIRLERERDEARAECVRWRDAVILHIGHVVTPDKFPWENAEFSHPRNED